MSVFGRGSNVPAGAVNSERMEMAIQECVIISLTLSTAYVQPTRLDMVTDIFNRLVSQVARFIHALYLLITYSFQDMPRQVYQHALYGGRSQQGRERLHRPMRSQVLRGEQEGRGAASECWRKCKWSYRCIWLVKSPLQVTRRMFHCAKCQLPIYAIQSQFLHLESLSIQPISSRRCTYTAQTSKVLQLRGLPVPGSPVLLQRIWEAFCHRFGVFVLRMFLKTEMAYESVLEVSPSEMRIPHTQAPG